MPRGAVLTGWRILDLEARMGGSGTGFRYFVAAAVVLLCLGGLNRADGLGTPFQDSSLVIAEASLVGGTPTSKILSFSDRDSYALSPSMAADSARNDEADPAGTEPSNSVPEPSGIVLGAFFAALFALVTLLRRRFDREAVRG